MPAPFLCFADFEFTCGGGINRWRTELLSVGLVICDRSFQAVQRFYSTVRPVKQPKMTALCRDLTNLTQEEINVSPDSNDVLEQVMNLIQQYPCDGLYVWGNYDQIGLTSDARIHKKLGLPNKYITKASASVTDVQKHLTGMMGLPDAVNISELSTAFGFVPESGTFHNAMNDAEGLYVSFRAVYTTDIEQNPAFQALRAERAAKREAAKRAAIERRNTAALTVAFSTEGQDYYNGLLKKENTQEAERFLLLRYTAIKVMRKYPDDKEYLITTVNGKVRAYRNTAYPKQFRTAKQRYYCFTEGTMDHALIAMMQNAPSLEIQYSK